MNQAQLHVLVNCTPLASAEGQSGFSKCFPGHKNRTTIEQWSNFLVQWMLESLLLLPEHL